MEYNVNKGVKFVSGAAIGAALMYLFDPQRGRNRRTQLQEKATSTCNRVGKALESTYHDLCNRAKGVTEEAEKMMSSGETTKSGTQSGGGSPFRPM